MRQKQLTLKLAPWLSTAAQQTARREEQNREQRKHHGSRCKARIQPGSGGAGCSGFQFANGNPLIASKIRLRYSRERALQTCVLTCSHPADFGTDIEYVRVRPACIQRPITDPLSAVSIESVCSGEKLW